MQVSGLNWRRWAFILGMTGCVQFILLTVLAMFLYPGGTHADQDTAGYSFWTNFFSDLGRTRTFSDQSNTASMVLFVIALSLASLALGIAFAAMPRLFSGSRRTHYLSIAGSVFGVLSALAYLGIASCPSNLNLSLHRLFVYIAFCSFLLVVVLYSAAIFLNKDYPNLYAFTYLGFALILAAYLVLLFGGPDVETEGGVRIQATGQKIVVYAEIICMFVQSYGALKMEKQLRAGLSSNLQG